MRGQVVLLRGSNVMVACEVPDVAVRNVCQDQHAAAVKVRGATPVFAAPDATFTRDRPLDQQLVARARS